MKLKKRELKTDAISLATHRAKVSSYNIIEDAVGIDMNRLDLYHTFNYNGYNVTWKSGYPWAWARSTFGWHTRTQIY